MKYLAQLSQSFTRSSNPEQALQMEAYLRNQFKCFGIKTPQRRKLQNEFIRQNGLPKYNELERLVLELFHLPEREFHYFAIEICEKIKEDWKPNTIKLFEKMAMTNPWWDSVDSINKFCIKPYFAEFPENTSSITQSWIDSNNIWLQRLSIIFQLRLTDKTDAKLLSRNILQLNHSEEFFVQKAIGWALRDYWRTDPEWVKTFVAKHELKPLSKREALKHVC